MSAERGPDPTPSHMADPSPMWLAHHDAAHADRCVRLGGVHVCRRCAVLYPVAVLTAVLVVLLDPPNWFLVAGMWILPALMAIEWIGEHLGWIRYSPPRQVALTAIGAPALGAAVALHAASLFTPAAVAPILVWGGLCAGVALVAHWRSEPAEDAGWLERHEAAEDRRLAELTELLASSDRAADRSPTGTSGSH